MNEICFAFLQTFFLFPSFVIALTIHEYAHAAMATLLGDATPGQQGRLTLNPFAHIDPVGLLFLLIFRMGWAKPVQFNPHNFKYPKMYTLLTALSGPASNLLGAIAIFSLIKHVSFCASILRFLDTTAYMNIMLGVFNMIPIPPFDGGHLVEVLTIDTFPNVILWLRRYASFIFLLLFLIPQVRLTFTAVIHSTYEVLKALAL